MKRKKGYMTRHGGVAVVCKCELEFSRVKLPPKTLGGDPSLSLPASGSPRHSLACRGITPVSTTVVTCLPSPCVSLCLHMVLPCLLSFSFLKDPCLTGLGPTHMKYDLIVTWLHLQRPYFQVRSHLQGQCSGLQPTFLRDVIQLTTPTMGERLT